MSRLEQKYRYYAFISYNHRDERVAKWLQRQLEHYRLPSVARKEIGEDVKIRPVFRYAVNLSLGDLRRQVKEELDASRFLIVICSPNSAQPNIEGKHWVNDEATRFIETGRVDDIIPVIVDGEPNVGGDRECFPPALRNREIAGANLSKGSRSERRRDFLKIVAKLLGILPDQLIRHTEEEEKHARFRFWLKLLPLAILAAVGGLFAWDSTRTVQNYYADYVDSYGLPEGIFPLKKTEIAHRHVHYRFEYRGFQFGASPHADSSDWCIWRLFGLRRRLVRVVQANSHGYSRTWDHSQYSDRPQIQDFTYDRDQRLCEIRYGRYNGEGREPYLEKRIELSNENGEINNLLQFFAREGRLGKAYAMASTTLSEDSGFKSKSDIVQHMVTRDKNGRVERRLFLNSSGANVQDSDGLYGFGYEHDDYGRQTAQWYLFRDGSAFSRRANKKGVAGRRYEYSGRNMKKVEYMNQTGKPVLGPQGWKVIICTFDTYDNCTESWCYDDDGKKMLCAEGYSGRCAEYDTYGNMTRQRFHDADGRPTLHKEGNAGWKAEYDELGRVVRKQFLDVDGRPTLLKVGCAEFRSEYDGCGNYTRESYFDINGKPTLNKNGYAGWKSEYDARGNTARTMYLGIEGKPTLHKDGYAGWEVKYNEAGYETYRQYIGIDGNPTLHKDGYAAVRFAYDVRGNVTRVTYLDVGGKPTLHKVGIAEVCVEYDEHGNETRRRGLGLDGKPALDERGCAEIRSEYCARGNLTRVKSFGLDGKATLNKDGYAECRMEYDVYGNVARWMCFGSDGKPALSRDGYAETRIEYDARGNNTRQQFFGIDGKATLHKDGYSEIRNEYDSRDNTIRKQYFGVDGSPTLHVNDGCAGWVAEYDKMGRQKRKVWIGVDGKPTFHEDGCSEVRREYDIRGNVIRESYFGIDGKLTLCKNGFAEMRYEYDTHDNVTKQSYCGVDGKPTLCKYGYAVCVLSYDARGNVIREQLFGVDGKPTLNTQGYAEHVSEYDERGRSVRRILAWGRWKSDIAQILGLRRGA